MKKVYFTVTKAGKNEKRMSGIGYITETDLLIPAIAIALLERYQNDDLINHLEEDIKNLYYQTNIEYIKPLSNYSSSTSVNKLIIDEETGEIVDSLYAQCNNSLTYDADATIKFSNIFDGKFKII